MAGTITQLIKLTGAEEVKSQLTAIGKEGEKAFSGIEKSAQSASGSVSKVGGAAETAGTSILSSGQSAALAAGAFAGLAAAAVRLAQSYFSAASAASQLVTEQARAAQRAGQTTKNYTESTGALRILGLQAGDAQQAVEKFGAGAVQAYEHGLAKLKAMGVVFPEKLSAAGMEQQAQMIANVGGSSKEASKEIGGFFTRMKLAKGVIDPTTGALKSDQAAWENYAESIKKIENPLERIKELTKTFGEAQARTLEPVLSRGAEGVREAFADQRFLTGGKTEADIKARDKDAKGFETATSRLSTGIDELKTAAGIDAAKNLTGVTNVLADGVGKVNTFATEYSRFKESLGSPIAATGLVTIAQLFADITAQALGLKTSAEETKTSVEQIGASAPDFSGLVAAANTAFAAILEGARRTAEALRRILPGGGSPALVVPSGPGEMASGGSVRGPGSGTSDSILARLSNGEYVVKAAAVRHYGPGVMEAINSMRFAGGGPVPGFAGGGQAAGARGAQELVERAVQAGFAAANATNKAMQEHHKKISEILNSLLQAFTGGIGGIQIGFGPGPVNQLARGGLVGGLVGALSPRLVPGLAGGGLVPAPSQNRSLHPVTISLPGGNNVSGLTAPPSVVDRLEREVLLKSPAGRAPSWRGR